MTTARVTRIHLTAGVQDVGVELDILDDNGSRVVATARAFVPLSDDLAKAVRAEVEVAVAANLALVHDAAPAAVSSALHRLSEARHEAAAENARAREMGQKADAAELAAGTAQARHDELVTAAAAAKSEHEDLLVQASATKAEISAAEGELLRLRELAAAEKA